VIEAREISFGYKGDDAVLHGMSFQEESGHFIALLGNNGAGKSTFLKCLNRILEPKKGVISVDSTELAQMSRGEIAKKLAYVEQHTETTQLSVYDTVLLGRKPHLKFEPTDTDYEIVDEAIKRFGLSDMSLRNIDELYGGEFQKVVLARAIAQKPRILLLDEPTASLDLRNQHEVMGIAAEIAKKDGIMVIVVIHDLNLALKYCDRFLFVHEGTSFCYGDSSIVTKELIGTVYGVETAIMEIGGSKVVVVTGDSGRT